ncbi:tetratricopeptide repeat protein [Seonamhaeicola marinus]|uniref:Tetratricopeptide repeat protein n=1 Tax=Seonamhaeicola marinus TaxID=1912246 RepID=A0A5D0HY08_9FLAO|nr:tetratricopeptide repeat protein [Seonamhaeicola marinus]TYA74342.1 tetratricopeptide repeat protein [Seonamhaeicola marinus]
MNRLLLIILTLFVSLSFAQDKDKAQLLALKKANNYVYEGNKVVSEDFTSGEVEYRKAISEHSKSVEGNYNLGNAYYNNGNLEEALYRHQQAANNATSKSDKHKAFHNIGNILMQREKCTEAVEAYKSALRNNPSDNETRYNLALAKECAQKEKENKDQNEDDKNNQENKDDKDKENKEDENKENKDDKGDNKNEKENDDKGDQKEKEGDNKEDENKDPKDNEGDNKDDKDNDDKDPKDEKNDKGKNGDKEEDEKKQKPKPRQGRMSPQQIKNLLDAMNNQEQKVQKKMNVQKGKGAKVKTDKDW